MRECVEIVRRSTDDLDVVNEAFAGADTVFWLVPPNPRAESIPGHILNFVRPMCDAINNQGVKRVIGVSSLGRRTAKNAGQISAIFATDHLIGMRSAQTPGFGRGDSASISDGQ